MKAPFVLGLFFAATCMVQAADTAYSALRVVGKRDGQEVLNRVLEVRGKSGTPQPDVWKVTIEEPRARGGVREIEVQRGKIVSERTPNTSFAGRPMNFNQLNLDSEGAFSIANQEAQKERVAFDRINYMLKSGSNGGAPVWELELLDPRGGRLGTFAIAADSGNVLHRQIERSAVGSSDDHAYLDNHRDPAPRDGGGDDPYFERNKGLPGFLNRVGRHFQKRGQQLGNFFTGK